MTADSFAFLRGRRGLILTAVLAAQGFVMHAVSRQEVFPAAAPLSQFPTSAGRWSLLKETPVDEETQAVLRADDTLSRYYYRQSGGPPASLFVAFFRSQRRGQAPHSPKNCLPGSGWVPTESSLVSVSVPGEPEPIRINRYIVSKGNAKSVVLYWYQSHNRVIASEYASKLYLVTDSIRYNRSDTALVRIVVTVPENGDAEASAAAEDFVRAVFPLLRTQLPA